MVNYYRRFVPDMAMILSPLHGIIKEAGKEKKIKWSKECNMAFDKVKRSLSDAVLLHIRTHSHLLPSLSMHPRLRLVQSFRNEVRITPGSPLLSSPMSSTQLRRSIQLLTGSY